MVSSGLRLSLSPGSALLYIGIVTLSLFMSDKYLLAVLALDPQSLAPSRRRELSFPNGFNVNSEIKLYWTDLESQPPVLDGPLLLSQYDMWLARTVSSLSRLFQDGGIRGGVGGQPHVNYRDYEWVWSICKGKLRD
jgi:hypothetical protein